MVASEPLDDTFGYGVAASRPAAGIEGRVYYSTDTEVLERDNGTTWDDIPLGGGGSLTVQESDGSPTSSAITTLVFPNDSVTIASTTATIRQVPTGFIGAAVYASANVSTSNSGEAVVAMDSELFDTDSFHNTVTNNGRFTVPAGMGGKYLYTYSIHISSTPGASGYIIVRKNNTTVLSMCNFHWDGSSHGSSEGSGTIDLAAGDYIELKNLTNTVATMTGTTSWAPWFTITKLDSGKVGGGIGARVYHSANVSTTSADFSTLVAFNSETFDTDGFHDTSTNNARLTIPPGLGGKYVITANVEWAANSSGVRYLFILSASLGILAGINTAPVPAVSDVTRQSVTAIADLAAGDYVSILATQSSGGALNLVANTGWSPSASIMRLDSSANNVYPPGYEYNYVEVTADTTVAGTSEGSPTSIITSGSVTCDGSTTVLVEFFCAGADLQSVTTSASIIFDLYEDSTILGRIAIVSLGLSATNDTRSMVRAVRRRTPASGAHTYTVKAWKSGTVTATVHAGAGGTGAFVPAFIRITKV